MSDLEVELWLSEEICFHHLISLAELKAKLMKENNNIRIKTNALPDSLNVLHGQFYRDKQT